MAKTRGINVEWLARDDSHVCGFHLSFVNGNLKVYEGKSTQKIVIILATIT